MCLAQTIPELAVLEKLEFSLYIYLKAFSPPRNLRICFLLKLTVCGFSGKLT